MTLDEAIEHAKEVARTCDDSQCAAEHMQLAEWLRTARGAEKASRWYTSKIRELEEENAKLVSVLHEVEEDAVYAYHSLQHDIEAMVSGSSHYFLKWWHAECESDRLKRDNAKLLKKVSCLLTCANDTGDCDRCPLNGGTGDWNSEDFCDDLLDCLRELGIEVV